MGMGRHNMLADPLSPDYGIARNQIKYQLKVNDNISALWIHKLPHYGL